MLLYRKRKSPIQKAIPGKYPLVVMADKRLSCESFQFDANAVCIPLISTSGHGKKDLRTIHYQTGRFALGNILCAVIPKSENALAARFLYYFLLHNKDYLIVPLMRGGANVSLSIDSLRSIRLPIPPLQVQQEIVRILDKFTALEAELEAELEARKKQYEYYREKLLTLPGAPRMTLGDIALDMYRGSGIKRDQLTEAGTPCVRYGEIYTTYHIWFDSCVSHTDEKKISSKKYFHHGDILFAITGESVDEIAKSCAYIGDETCLAGGDIVVMKHNQNPKYLAYALSTKNAQLQKSKGRVKSKVVHSSIPVLKDIEIPIPPIDEQKRIAAILDRFDTLINDLTQGLPAEIAARRKQYEYYRDKLLTFKEKVS